MTLLRIALAMLLVLKVADWREFLVLMAVGWNGDV